MNPEPVVSRCLRLGVIALFAVCAAACSTTKGAQAPGVREVFADRSTFADNADIPSVSTKTSTLDVPFEDVFRLANLSASQAQLNVEDVQKGSGLILATRNAMMPSSGNDGSSVPYRFYYAITIVELGPRRTQVRISAKVQGQCSELTAGSRVGLAVMSFGITELMVHTLGDTNACDRASVPHWASGFTSAETEMSQFMVFLRNNLLAARLI